MVLKKIGHSSEATELYKKWYKGLFIYCNIFQYLDILELFLHTNTVL